MVNPWVEHVRKYAKDNNISYGCAISEAKATYIKVNKKEKEKQEADNVFLNLLKRIRKQYLEFKDKDETKFKFLKSNFNKKNDKFKAYVKNKAPTLYNELIFTKKDGIKNKEKMED